MAVYQFSALSDGQAISFNASADQLNFDQTAVGAGDLSLVQEGTSLHVIVKSGTQSGKDIFLSNTALEQIAGGTNFTFADGSVVRIGDNTVATAADAAGNNLAGGTGRDLVMGLGGNDTLAGGDNNDSLIGGTGNDNLNGNNGNDWMEGSAGNDTLTGSGGQDTFIFREAGAANADSLPDFSSNWDAIQLDAAGFSAIGAAGRFSAGDPRFFAGAAAHDADDRIIFNSANGQLLYDPDGNGAQAAQLIATLGAGRTLVAGDITVIGTAGGGGGGQTINGTSGDDSLVGGPGNDTINALAGNDTLDGQGGTDVLNGGDGADTYIQPVGDTIIDSGGHDTVALTTVGSYTLGAGMEDLLLLATSPANPAATPNYTLTGTSGDNFIAVYNPTGTLGIIDGGGGNDTLYGSAGSEHFIVRPGTQYIGGGDGIDRIDLSGSENGFVSFTSFTAGTVGVQGPNSANASFWDIESAIGGTGNDILVGGSFSVELSGWIGNDTLVGGDGNDTLHGGGFLNDFGSNESGADSLAGGRGNDVLIGGGGSDTLNGGLGNDTLAGEAEDAPAGVNHFVFDVNPGAADADVITDFISGRDKIHLDARVMPNVGAGDFTAGDPRFFAGAGANSGHDADDRIVFNTSTGEIWYDADGSGAGVAQLIARIGATPPALAATDIVIDNASAGSSITGTAGDDTLTGTPGNDTIDGLGGNDSIDGFGGSDSLIGGAGNDYLYGGGDPGDAPDHFIGGDGNDTLDGWVPHEFSAGPDTMDGGAGDDLFIVDRSDDILTDSGGVDTVDALDVNWTLAPGFENLIINSGYSEGFTTGTGNDLANTMQIAWQGRLEGRGGDDTLLGGDRSDELYGGDGNDLLNGTLGSYRTDTLDGGAGNDTLTGNGVFMFDAAPGAANADLITNFTSGQDTLQFDGAVFGGIGFTGRFAAGDARFFAAPGASAGHDADDRIVYNTASGQVWFDADGSGAGAAQLVATLQGAPALAANDINVIGAPGAVINGTAGNDSLVGTTSNDTLNGFDGNDTLDGGLGADSMVGGNGNDIYIVDNAGDIVVEQTNAGIDEVRSSINLFTLPDFVNNLTLTGTAGIGYGNSIDNVLRAADGGGELHGDAGNDTLIAGAGNSSLNGDLGNDSLVGGNGNDQLIGGAGNDTISGGAGDDVFMTFFDASTASGFGNDVLDGGAGFNWLELYDPSLTGGVTVNVAAGTASDEFGTIAFTNVQAFMASNNNDTLIGGAGNERFFGERGNDTLNGGAGNDTLIGDGNLGSDGADTFILSSAPGAANADFLSDFWSGTDTVQLDASVMSALGASGRFAVGDARFYSAAGASGGHDADDRIVLDTSTGNLWYDADGNGAGSAQLIATVGSPNGPLAATDLVVVNGTSGGGGGGGQTINGTAGNDSLTGGPGNDTLDGGAGIDTMNGQAGDDTYFVTAGDVLADPSGNDTVMAGTSWALGAGFENLTLTGTANLNASGNSASNTIVGNSGSNDLRARDGNDTVTGGGGRDFFDFTTAPSAANADTITDFVSGTDELEFEDAAFTAIGATGAWAATDGRFFAGAGVTSGHDATDRVVYNTTTGQLYYDADGSGAGAAVLVATLQGAPTVSATDITVI